jgi:hypothetical protein
MTCMRILIRLITDADPVFWFTVYLMRIRFRILDWCGSGSRLQNDGNPDPQHCFYCVRISSFSAIAYLLVPLADDHKLLLLINQGFGSESVSGSAWIRINLGCWICIRIRIQIEDPHTNWGSGSGSRRSKMAPKNRKKDRIFIFWSAVCSLFSILDHQTLVPEPESGSGIRIRNPYPQLEKMLDPNPDPH